MVAEKNQQVKRGTTKQPDIIPDYLICEIMDGQPLYYKGYRDVVNKKKNPEDIMGSSTLQAMLISYLMEIIVEGRLKKSYEVLISEAGLHLNKNNNLAGDIMIYDPSVLPPSKINKRYADVPPKIIMEVDIMIEMENLKDAQYMRKKVDKLHAFGTEKVLWILTASRQVVIAPNAQPWQVLDWNNDIELLDGIHFNIGNYLQSKGIVVED